MGLTLSSYVVGTVAAAALVVGIIAAAGKWKRKATADAAQAAKEAEIARIKAIVANFDYSLPPELEGLHFGLPPNDGHEWVEYVPPPRIKQSDVSAEERAEYLEHIRLCFEDDTLLGRRIIFDPHDVGALCQRLIPYLASEQTLIEDVPFGITVVGDIHGQLHDLHRVFKLAEKDGKPGWECAKFLFLGNYVDRGRQSLEVLMVLFSLKMLYPDRIFLLRGNHEFDEENSHGGFAADLGDRYSDETAMVLYRTINEVFGYLSLAAIIGENRYFCAHAGMSPVGMTRDRLNTVCKPILKADEDAYIVHLTCSDPAEGLMGTLFNSDAGRGLYYGADSLALALYTADALVLLRGHTVLKTGYQISAGSKCISLFTATGIAGHNDAAVGRIDEDGHLKIVVLEFDAKRHQLDKMQKGWDVGGKGDVAEGRREDGAAGRPAVRARKAGKSGRASAKK